MNFVKRMVLICRVHGPSAGSLVRLFGLISDPVSITQQAMQCSDGASVDEGTHPALTTLKYNIEQSCRHIDLYFKLSLRIKMIY